MINECKKESIRERTWNLWDVLSIQKFCIAPSFLRLLHLAKRKANTLFAMQVLKKKEL